MNITKLPQWESFDDTISGERIDCDALINVMVKDKFKKVLGRAILTYHTEQINGSEFDYVSYYVLADIIIYDPEMRKKGIGSKLMLYITKEFDVVISLPDQSTGDGIELCKKFGFKYHKAIHKKDNDMLIFKKEAADGGEQKPGGGNSIERPPDSDGGIILPENGIVL